MDPPVHETNTLEAALLELPYIPDFLLEDLVLWFVPSRVGARGVYHDLRGPSASSWAEYYLTKKGWRFLSSPPAQAEGPFRVHAGGIELRILPQGRIFSPRPVFHFGPAEVPEGKTGEKGIPILSLPKQRPLNPWKPNYIQALNFIKKYEWPHPLPRSDHYAIWEIEECGQIAGSVSWKNAEGILRRDDSPELRETLVDIFYNRPEDYPLGSEVYLRVLGLAGEDGFAALCKLAEHPVSRKRKIVANTLGALGNPKGIERLLHLLEDEDPDVRRGALRAIGRVGITGVQDPDAKVASYLQSPEIPYQVWASQALLKGGDKEQEKFLLTLVKEQPRLLTDMGELGDVIADLKLEESVPYLINRLKHEKAEFRADAAEALAKVTGLNIEYQSLDTEEQRRSAIKAYQRWWDDRKRERRKSR